MYMWFLNWILKDIDDEIFCFYKKKIYINVMIVYWVFGW